MSGGQRFRGASPARAGEICNEPLVMVPPGTPRGPDPATLSAGGAPTDDRVAGWGGGCAPVETRPEVSQSGRPRALLRAGLERERDTCQLRGERKKGSRSKAPPFSIFLCAVYVALVRQFFPYFKKPLQHTLPPNTVGSSLLPWADILVRPHPWRVGSAGIVGSPRTLFNFADTPSSGLLEASIFTELLGALPSGPGQGTIVIKKYRGKKH